MKERDNGDELGLGALTLIREEGGYKIKVEISLGVGLKVKRVNKMTRCDQLRESRIGREKSC